MLTVYVTTESNCYISGLRAWDTTYDTYSRREFIQRFREANDLKGKHIKFVWPEEQKTFADLIMAVSRLYRK